MQEKNLKIRNIGIVIISIFVLTSLSSLGFFEPVYADHSSKLIKMQREYPADAGFIDIALPMKINNINSTIVFLSFSTPDSADQADTSRRWELINDRTLRVFGESNTPVGNNAGNLIIYILEMRSEEFNVNTQNFVFNFTASETLNKQSIALSPAINSSRGFALFNGLENLADETTWGSEEFYAVQVNDTHLDFEVTDIPNTAGVLGFSVIHANETGILAQRGSGFLDGASETDDVITPPIAIDRDHTIVLITGRIDGATIENADPDEVMVQVTINPSNDIVIHRDDDAPLDFIYEWQTMSFPPTLINVTHGEISMVDGETIITDTITPVLDMDKSFVISGAGSPFGYGTGACDTGSAGAMDRCMNRLILTDMDTVSVTREDSTGTNIVNYQVIQILETEVAEEPQGTNTLKQIIKIKGTVAGVIEHDVTISPALTNVNKTIAFLTFESDGTGGGDPSGGRKSYEILNSTTLRVFGNSDPTVTNPSLNFTATLVEFDDSSPIVVQPEFFNYPQGLVDSEKTIHMSPINTTGSAITSRGRHLSGVDGTVGAEEIDQIRILTSNTWGYDTDAFQGFSGNDGSTVVRADIIDFNENEIFSQRGQLSMSTTTASVTPPIAITQNQTMLLFSHTTSDGDLTASPDTSTVHATIDSTGDIDFFRPVATGTLEINWELISYPTSLLKIEHGIHHQDIATTNATSTVTPVVNLDRSFAIGTEGLFGHGSGSGDNAVDATASFLDVISTVELEDDSTVRVVRGTSTGDFDVGFQVIQFTGQVFNQDVTDFVTVVDLSTQFDITKAFSETVPISDLVNVTTIRVVNINDVTNAFDVTSFDITKLLTDTEFSTDGVNINMTKVLSDIANVADQVESNVTTVFDLSLLDTVSTNDIVLLNTTKVLQDVASGSDNLNFNTTKSFIDITNVNDEVVKSLSAGGMNITDVTVSIDTLFLDVTKLVNDIVTTSDSVIVTKIANVTITDTVFTSDNVILIVTTIPTGTGGGGAPSSGSIPSVGTPLSPVRLIGLNIASEVIVTDAGETNQDEFFITWFGDDFEDIKITGITAEDEFIGFNQWIQFSPLPDQLNVEQDFPFQNRPANDPRSLLNTALDDFVVEPPRNLCTGTLIGVSTSNCFNPIIYEIPLEFEFDVRGATFKHEHILVIDGRFKATCEVFQFETHQLVCDVYDFTLENWWWLAGLGLFLWLIPKFVHRGQRKVRVAHFVSGRNDDVLGNDKTSKRLKRLKKTRS